METYISFFPGGDGYDLPLFASLWGNFAVMENNDMSSV